MGREEKAAAVKVLHRGNYSRSIEREQLEREFSEFIGIKYAVALSCGTAGLHCSLLAVGVKNTDEVVSAANTHSSPIMSIMNVGAKPVLVDIDPETFNIDQGKIEEKITAKTKAILPIHAYGHPYDADPIIEIAKKRGLAVVENAPQSLGAKYKNRKVGTLSDVAIFSFGRHKHLEAGGRGGIVVTNNEEIADKVRALAYQGRGGQYQTPDEQGVPRSISDRIGFSYRIGELNAAIARVQLKKFRNGTLGVEKRRKVAKHYCEAFKQFPQIQRPIEKEWAYHSYQRYVIRIKDRNKLYTFLSKRNIYVGIHFRIPIYKEPYYVSQFGELREKFPATEQVAQEILTLPTWPRLKNSEQKYVIDSIRKFYDT